MEHINALTLYHFTVVKMDILCKSYNEMMLVYGDEIARGIYIPLDGDVKTPKK
jgi:hypothetical protein